MRPTLEPGDWLLLDPTVRRWPRRGSVVVVREPETGVLAVKRIAAGPLDRIRVGSGLLHLGPDEAWLRADADAATTAAAGHGPPRDSRRYGPVRLERLVARAWFRIWPLGRIGPIRRSRARQERRDAAEARADG